MALRKKKRTLADDIAELTNPAPLHPDVDPEMADFGGDALRAVEVGEFEDDQREEDDRRAPRDAPRRLHLRGSIAIEGGRYRGKTTSRKELLESGSEEDPTEEDGISDDEEEEEEEGEEEDEGEDEDEEEEEDEDDNSDEEKDASQKKTKRGRISRKEREEEDGRDTMEASESDEGGEDAEMAGIGLPENNEIQALEKECQQILKQEEEMMQTVRSRSVVDYKKAESVTNQRVLWDKTLELYIISQRLLASGNRLPQPDSWKVFQRESAAASAGLKQVASAAVEALQVTLDLQKTLLDRNEAIAARSGATLNGDGVKRVREEDGNGEAAMPSKKMRSKGDEASDVDAIWHRMEEQYTMFVPFRNRSVDRWQQKVQLSAGAAAVKGRLRALNQSITTQVASAMRNPGRLISRTRLKRAHNQVIGKEIEAFQRRRGFGSKDSSAAAAAAAAVDECGNGSTPQEDEVGGAVEEEEDDEDPETFDDCEFFQHLLREFLETSSAGNEGNLSHYALKKFNSRKKYVDRRASKGRKLRYTVLPALVNFMVPEMESIPEMTTKLFATLFGRQMATKGTAVPAA